MILEKIKVSVQTNTKVKFITSIPVTITIREALPTILKAYQAVVHENYDQDEGQELYANRIKTITKNGFLIPLAEEVIHVLNDSDQLFVTMSRQEKKEHEPQISKKEKLEAKKEEKKLEKMKEKIVEQKKSPQQPEKKHQKPITKQQKAADQKKDEKKQDSKVKENRTNIPNGDIDKLLLKIRGEPAKIPVKVDKPRIVIVQTPSESSDSDS